MKRTSLFRTTLISPTTSSYNVKNSVDVVKTIGSSEKMGGGQGRNSVNRTWLVTFLFFVVVTPLLFSPFIKVAFAQEEFPTIGEFQMPSTVYADTYFTLNSTINDFAGSKYLANATLELSSSIQLIWENTEGFSLYADPGNYCSLDPLRSSSAVVNATAYKLVFSLKLDWTCPTEHVELVPIGTRVFNVAGSCGNSSTAHSFLFVNELILNLENTNESRLDFSNIGVVGNLYYEDTVIPPCKGSSALRFDGASFMNCGSDSALFWHDAGSVAFWARIDPLGRWQHPIDRRGYGTGTPWEGYGFAVNHANNLYFAVTTDVGEYNVGYWSDPVDGEWHHYVGIWGNNESRLYVDGVQKGATVVTEGSINVGENYPLLIGARQAGYGFASGVLDDVHIYNRTLSPSEVWALFEGICISEAGLVLNLPLDGDIKDTSIELNHVVIQGSNWTWTDGYADVKVVVELNGVIKQVGSLVNSTNGLFSVSQLSQDSAGWYCYRVYPIAGKQGLSQTTCIVADRLKIVEGGISASSADIGETRIVWFKAVYESDNSIFNGDSGVLFLNGSAMKWSASSECWIFDIDSAVPGTENFGVTGFFDRTYGLTTINDVVGFQGVTVKEHANPFSWTNMLLLGLLVVFSSIGVFGFRIRKVLLETT